MEVRALRQLSVANGLHLYGIDESLYFLPAGLGLPRS